MLVSRARESHSIQGLDLGTLLGCCDKRRLPIKFCHTPHVPNKMQDQSSRLMHAHVCGESMTSISARDTCGGYGLGLTDVLEPTHISESMAAHKSMMLQHSRLFHNHRFLRSFENSRCHKKPLQFLGNPRQPNAGSQNAVLSRVVSRALQAK